MSAKCTFAGYCLTVLLTGELSAYYSAHMGRSIDRDADGRIGAAVQTSVPIIGRAIERSDPSPMTIMQSYLGASSWPPTDLLPPYGLPDPEVPTPFKLPVHRCPTDTCTGKAAVRMVTLIYFGPQTKCPNGWTEVLRPRFRLVPPPTNVLPGPILGDEGPILIDPGAHLPQPVQVGLNLECYSCTSGRNRCLSRFRACIVVKESLTCKCEEGDLEI